MWAKLLMGYNVMQRFDLGYGPRTLYQMLFDNYFGLFDGDSLVIEGTLFSIVTADDGWGEEDGIEMHLGLKIEYSSPPSEEDITHSIPFDEFEDMYRTVETIFRELGIQQSPRIFTLTTETGEDSDVDFYSSHTRDLLLKKLESDYEERNAIASQFAAFPKDTTHRSEGIRITVHEMDTQPEIELSDGRRPSLTFGDLKILEDTSLLSRKFLHLVGIGFIFGIILDVILNLDGLQEIGMEYFCYMLPICVLYVYRHRQLFGSGIHRDPINPLRKPPNLLKGESASLFMDTVIWSSIMTFRCIGTVLDNNVYFYVLVAIWILLYWTYLQEVYLEFFYRHWVN